MVLIDRGRDSNNMKAGILKPALVICKINACMAYDSIPNFPGRVHSGPI